MTQETQVLNEILAAADIDLALVAGVTTRADEPLIRLRELVSELARLVSADEAGQ